MLGGKTQLLTELRKYVPTKFGRYHEPFIGGGALYFDLAPEKATLNDINPRLMAAYRGIQADVGRVIKFLRIHEAEYKAAWRWLPHEKGEPRYGNAKTYYLQVRADARTRSDVAMAAWVVFLSKTAFNGVWRENLSGGFNVPPGKYKSIPLICDEKNLRAVSAALQGVKLACGDFAGVEPKRGDLWYADCPYWPKDASSDFTSYNKAGFGPADQVRLRDHALALKKQGVHVMLTNADVTPVRQLYTKDFEIHRVHARRFINSKTEKRGPVGELIIT
jgi:DNA adenine methylase